MRLRRLKIKDAPLMLEWMRDESVTYFLASNFKDKTLKNCQDFIRSSWKDRSNIHLAIVSNDDEYMGTVSLKRIDCSKKRAEFAITIRKIAMGRGFSWFGMNEIIKKGFSEFGLDSIYWCVSKDNVRACKFYDKHMFNEMLDIEQSIQSNYQTTPNLKWYIVKKEEMETHLVQQSNLIKLFKIKTIGTENAGQLSFIEGSHDIPFDIKRVYYISNVDEGVKRGFHAHKNLKQLLFCPYGKIGLLLDDGHSKEEIILDSPSLGLLIEQPLWREMTWIENNSVLCVLASDYYIENDYIRDYSSFLEYIKNINLK